MLQLKRAYELPEPDDGLRVLVDRDWPCGVHKADAHIDVWLKEIAPSEALTTWWRAHKDQWREFYHRYWAELRRRPALTRYLNQEASDKTVTLVYRAADTRHNSAVVLRDYLEWQVRLSEMRHAA